MPFLGPSNPLINKDTTQPLFNEVVGYNYDYLTNYDGVTALDFRKTTSEQQVSLMFVLSAARSVTSVEAWMRATLLLSGTITATIFPEGSGPGIPATTGSLGASAAVDAATLSVGSYAKVKFTFSSPIALNAGQNYYIVLTSTVTTSATDYMQIASDNTPVGFVRSGKYNGATWSAQTYQSTFIVYYKTTTKIAQGFLVAGNQTLDHVILWLDKTATPAGSLLLEIRADSGGSPATTGPANNISDPVLISSFSGSSQPITFTFPTPPALVDGLTYHFVLSTTGTFTVSSLVSLGIERTTPSYGAGKISVDNLDGTWRILEEDGIFEVYYVTEVASNTLGDELALLGDPPLDCRAQQIWLKGLITTLSSFYPSLLPPLYGGTGIGEYEPGDMLYATDNSHLERLTIGLPGQTLGISLASLPLWGGGGANLILSLKNNSPGTLTLGDVVVFDIADTDAVDVSSLISNRLWAGVVQETIPAGEYGPILIHGRTQIRINGSVSAGDFLDTSAVSKRAYKAEYGPIKALQSGSSGNLIYAYVNVGFQQPPYARFSDVQAFNVNGTTLTGSTFTQVGLNTTDYVSHTGLYTLAANQLTIVQSGQYRVYIKVPIHGVGTLTSAMAKLRKTSGGGADVLSADSPFFTPPATVNASTIARILGEFTAVAGDVYEVQAYSIGSAALQAGKAHSVTGHNNRYAVWEIWKMKD